MIDISAHLRIMVRAFLVCVAAGLLLWWIAPAVRPIVAGFILGSLASMLGSYHLSRKIEKLTRLIVTGKGKRAHLGFAARICMSLIAVFIALKNPQFELASTIVGLFYAQLVILSMGFLSVISINRK